ncbi:hypothetical protein AX16_003249 [Volvariella volvacea WC 439]|nr:hypothetical protein AX16_003249 [Volvariella volvacea WC 439]
MSRLYFSALVALVSLVPSAFAEVPRWGQCGGLEYRGDTDCVAGTSCVFINEHYSHCKPNPPPPVLTPPPTGVNLPGPKPTAPAGPNYWFSFGDSYTQTGFNPYGEYPNDANPIGNPPYPGWTSTGGENWVGYVTTKYNSSQIYTYNFAYGGATIDANLVKPYMPTVLSLTDQVNQYLETVASKPPSTPWKSYNSLFSIWIGINDIGNSFWLEGDRDAFSDVLLDAEFALVEKLSFPLPLPFTPNPISNSNSGARNFLFVNVPPIYRSPLMLAQPESSRDLEARVIAGFNSKLAARAKALKVSHPGVRTWIWDSHAGFTKILDAPQDYGFTDIVGWGHDPTQFWG